MQQSNANPEIKNVLEYTEPWWSCRYTACCVWMKWIQTFHICTRLNMQYVWKRMYFLWKCTQYEHFVKFSVRRKWEVSVAGWLHENLEKLWAACHLLLFERTIRFIFKTNHPVHIQLFAFLKPQLSKYTYDWKQITQGKTLTIKMGG